MLGYRSVDLKTTMKINKQTKKKPQQKVDKQCKNLEHMSRVFAMNLSEGKAAGGTPPRV